MRLRFVWGCFADEYEHNSIRICTTEEEATSMIFVISEPQSVFGIIDKQ